MKSSGQLEFKYYDIMPARPVRSGNQPVRPSRVNKVAPKTNNQTGKVSSKEARLIFYSNLASHNGPTVRVQRPNSYRLNQANADASLNSIDDNLMQEIDTDLPQLNSNRYDYIKKASETTKNAATSLKSSLALAGSGVASAGTKVRNRGAELSQYQFKQKMPFIRSKKIVFLAALLIIFLAVLAFGINQSVNNSRQEQLQESRAQAEWEQSKLEWECALARYESKQNNIPINKDKEKSCANIN